MSDTKDDSKKPKVQPKPQEQKPARPKPNPNIKTPKIDYSINWHVPVTNRSDSGSDD